jgi:hypothetical protein
MFELQFKSGDYQLWCGEDGERRDEFFLKDFKNAEMTLMEKQWDPMK